ncbi:hypothetical protein QTP70_015945 [Hemibagrus guttatus]|uniref:Uncharacterized protein n=1 Tax=Hemibagrus guttatus TaxID=175788 RepID=A0AAE0RBE1_9TELE|nr:hypothetical protein QTP70_015945 [Hemibagrus guttatus]KAK3570712.1 hypothetical protein QTP86_025257 [Hemibagrus guttatus]
MLHLRTTATPKVYQIHAVTGKPLRQVRHLAGPLRLQIGALHTEEIYLMVLENSTAVMVLGRPWLEQHDPILSWKSRRSPEVGGALFRGLLPTATKPKALTDVFCPKKPSKLPPHRPWDCTIDLIPGEPVLRGRIYSLSLPEEKAMEEYITEALAQGYICPSTSPAASSFFFVAEKDGGSRTCINYRALNKITVKFRYPLPLVPVALEHLHGTGAPPQHHCVHKAGSPQHL